MEDDSIQTYVNATVICGTIFMTVQFNLYPHINLHIEDLSDLTDG